MKSLVNLAAIVALLSATPAGAQCRMSPAFNQPDEGGARSIPVWADNGSLLFGSALNVNTDGTRRSYSVSDFWGEREALNNLCNAMSDACAGLNSAQLRERRLLTQHAAAAHWPADLLRQTRLSPAIIPMPNGRPCPEVGGYLVSATALHRPRISDSCDIANYVDALEVAALVLPKPPRRGEQTPFQARGAQVGDLIVAANADGSHLTYGVVGDLGPARELGEASIAMNGALLGRTEQPANYNHVRGRGEYRGRGWQVPFAFVLIFPRSRDEASPLMQRDRIDAAARQKFEQWGGVARLTACRGSYRPQ